MYKLNKKGFAVTTVVYSILVLLILFMFILLAIVRGSYFNEKDFTKEVQVELDTYLKNMGADTKKPVCTFDSSNIKLSVDQKVSVTLTCLDEAGIKEDTIDKDKDKFTYSNIFIEEISRGEGITDETDGPKSGYKYVIKIKGTDVGDATFTLNKSAIHDKSGNPNDSVSASLTVTEKISKPICTFTGPDKNPIVGAMDVTYYYLTCTGENLEITTLTKDNFTVDSSGINVVSVTADASNSTTKLSFTLTVRGGTLKGVASTITLPANSIKITGGDGNDAVTSNSLTYAECKEGAEDVKTSSMWCVTQGTSVSCTTPRKCTNGVWVDGEEYCDPC